MKIDFKDLKNKAEGNWGSIIASLDSRFADIPTDGKHAPCPVHGGSDGFRFFRNYASTGGGVCNTCGTFTDGLSLLQWAAGEDTVRPAAMRVQAMLNDGDIQQAPQSNKAPVRRDTSRIKKASEKQWGTANKLVSSSAGKYYEGRGLAPVGEHKSIRYHAEAPYYEHSKALVDDDGKWHTWPAIVCKMSDSKGCSGLVQILLTPEGHRAGVSIKQAGARDPQDKKFLSHRSLVGSAVRLGGEVGEDLAICEGLETGLAVHQMTGYSVAACCTANLMINVEIPPHVKRVHIFEDKDLSGTGRNAGAVLHESLKNDFEVFNYSPDIPIPVNQKGVDWLDYLNKYPDTNDLTGSIYQVP